MKRSEFFGLVFFCLLLLSQDIIAQTGQVWQCNTDESWDSLRERSSNQMSLLTTPIDTSAKVINVFVHVLRRTDGTGGLSNAQVSDWIELLCQDYTVHNIAVRQIGQADINNTTFYNGLTNATYSTLINTNTHSNAIDIYMLSPDDTYSRASGIPGIALTIGGSYVGTSVLSHEFGHCLGLYHTHSGRGCGDDANCSENINGSNCSTCGDLVCDTPADPCLSGNVDVNCLYTGDTSFDPDVHNTMSYAPPTCLNRITLGQKVRLHSIISSDSIFTNRAIFPTITGPSVIVCSGETFTLNNVPVGATVTWVASPGYFETNNGSGTSATLIPTDLTIGGSGIVIFTINTGCGNSVRAYSDNFLVQGLLSGSINFTNSENEGMYFCSSSYGNYFEIDTGAPGTNFEARLLDITGQTVLYTSPTTTYQAGTPNLWSYYPSSNGYYIFEVRGTNECGSTSWVGTEVEYVNCNWLFTVYPNPTDNYLDIELSDDIITETESYQITLVNYTGTEVLKTSSKKKKQRVDTSHLKKGEYILRIQYKGEVTVRRIVIDR
jgi:hypothetical protein